jgi:hypothetical protein
LVHVDVKARAAILHGGREQRLSLQKIGITPLYRANWQVERSLGSEEAADLKASLFVGIIITSFSSGIMKFVEYWEIATS